MHKLLERQLKKTRRSSPDGKVDYDTLLEMVNATYEEFDKERRLTDRSTELASKELLEPNRRIQEQSEARVQAIMDNVIDGIITCNEQGIIESFNPAAERIFGYSASETIGQNIDTLIPELSEDISKYLDIKQGLRREITGQRKDGSIFPMDLAISKTDLDERCVFFCVVRDITERKRAEEALRESLVQLSKKNRYETIISTVTQSVHKSINLQEVLENAVETMSKNIDGVDIISIYIIEGEEAVLKAHKGLPGWFIKRAGRIPYPKGATWKTIIEGKPVYCADIDQDTTIGPAGKELGTKSYLSMPIRYREKTIGVININSLKKNAFDEGELRLLEIVAQQIEIAINNAQQAEALHESEERFRLLVENVKNYAIFMLDTGGHIISWNAGAERIKGYKAEEIIGKHFSIFYPDEDLQHGKPQYGMEIAIAEGRY